MLKTKNLICVLWLGLIAVALRMDTTPILEGQGFPPPGNFRVNTNGLTGDLPLTTLATFSGNVDVVVKVVPHAGSGAAGTFTISTIPAGATIRKAWFITTSFSGASSETATATFAGTALGAKAPDKADAGGGLFCREYRFDVTPLVPGNGSFTYSVTGTTNVYGDALVVVYEHSSLPARRIVVNDGAEGLQNSTSTTSFDGFSAGAARMILFTQADDAVSGGGEFVAVNGATVLGPGDIFNANQGSYASLIDAAVTAVSGTNTVAVATAGDFFGLHLAILSGSPSAPPPTLTTIRPKSGVQGRTTNIRLTGENFVTGSTGVQVTGGGITVGAVNVSSPSQLTTTFTIDPAAALTTRDVTVSTPGGTSNALMYTVRAPILTSCVASLPLTVTGSRGSLGITAGLGTTRQTVGTWAVGWMVFNANSVSFYGQTLLSGTLPAANPPATRVLSANLEPAPVVGVLNTFYSPYLCSYTISWASTTSSATPYEPVPRQQVEAFLDSLDLLDYDGTLRQIPR
jgi:hypothetical protein